MRLRGIRVGEGGCGRAVAVGMASGARTAATITVRFRTASNVGVSAVSLVDADADVLAAAWPWREFRWRAGHKHYSAVIGRRPRVAMSSMSRGWSSGCFSQISIGRCKPHLCTAVPVGDAIPRAHDENNSVKPLRSGGTAGKNEPIRALQPISWRTGA